MCGVGEGGKVCVCVCVCVWEGGGGKYHIVSRKNDKLQL